MIEVGYTPRPRRYMMFRYPNKDTKLHTSLGLVI